MLRRWFLFLVCLGCSLPFLGAVTNARFELRVDEKASRILLTDLAPQVSLVVENGSRETISARIRLELLTPKETVAAATESKVEIKSGSQKLPFTLPFKTRDLTPYEEDQALWYRLHYRVSLVLNTTSASISESKVDGFRNFVLLAPAVAAAKQQLSTPRVREYFPETLLWQPQLTTDKKGRAQLDFKLADNITTWRMSVIGSTEDGEIGLAETDIRAFQPFFAELDPPRILTEGDQIIHSNNQIEFQRSGNGSPVGVQLVTTYYLPWRPQAEAAHVRSGDAEELRLATRFDKNEAKVGEEITCRVKAERGGFRGYGMLLAEIGLPPGAYVDRASLETAMRGSEWSINQYDVLPDRVVVYLWPRAGGSEFSFKFRPRFAMSAKASASSLYDYYNPEARVIAAPGTFVVR